MPLLAIASRYLRSNPDFAGFSSKIPGLPEGGESARRRGEITDFGSGYQGINKEKARKYARRKTALGVSALLPVLSIWEHAINVAPLMEDKPLFGLLLDWRKVGSLQGKIAWTQLASQHYGLNIEANKYPSVFGGLTTSKLIEAGKYKSSVSFLRKYSQLNYRLFGGNYAYRGVVGEQAEQILQSIEKTGKAVIDLNALSAWSTNPAVAGRFASSSNPDPRLAKLGQGGLVIKRRVSAEDVWWFSPSIGGGPSELAVGTKTGKLEVTAKDIFELPRGSVEAPFGVAGPSFYKGASRWKMHLWGDWNPKSLGFAHFLPSALIAGSAYVLYKHYRNKALNKLEALKSGGEAEISRHKHSDFGSEWRGPAKSIIFAKKVIESRGFARASSSVFKAIGLENFVAATTREPTSFQIITLISRVGIGKPITPSSIKRIERLAGKLVPKSSPISISDFLITTKEASKREWELTHRELLKVKAWAKGTGLAPILYTPQDVGALRTTVRHEALHQVFNIASENPYVKRLAEKAPLSLTDLFTVIAYPAENRLSETFAYGYQHNPKILSALERKGFKTFRTATRELESNRIEGLAKRGQAQILRRDLTDFASKWQGILRAVKGFRQEGVVFEVHPQSFLQKVGGNVGVGRSVVEELKSKILGGIQLDPGEIFFDEFNNVIGAEGRHRATAYMELGRQMPVRRMVREVMNAGEGESAVSSLPRRNEINGSRKMSKSL